MAQIDGGRIVAKALKQEGVEYIYALWGGHIDQIFQGCLDEGIRIIDVRHEQAAAFAAEGTAWMTGKPGVALVTAGPGVTNAVTGVWNAFFRAAPAVILGGRVSAGEMDRGGLQGLDSVKLMQPITKWARACPSGASIAEYISIAFRQATSGRPGPVYLDLPADILWTPMEESQVILPTNYRTEARPLGEPGLITEAVDLLLKAERPVMVAGTGIWWSQAAKELQEFAELVGIPVADGMTARFAGLPADHPLNIGFPDPRADVVFLLGARLEFILQYGQPPLFNKDSKWIQADIEATEIGRNRPIDIGIIGDAREVLKQMTAAARDRCEGRAETPWVTEIKARSKSQTEQVDPLASSDSVPIHPVRLCHEIRDYIDRDATVIIDGGSIQMYGTRILKAYQPGHWLSNLSSGTLGGGICFAMAAKLARPDKQVLLLSGDGTFGFNGMEIDTMVRHKLPIVCVVGNDEGWCEGVEYQKTKGLDRVIGTELGAARYDKMVESLGGYGERVEKPEDIRPALERAFASGLPACIDVRIAGISPISSAQLDDSL